MYSLVICEKPSQARGYAAVLGANERGGGFFIGGGYIVSYCFGHLLELAPPDAYDAKYAKWRYSDLPIIPEIWKHVPAKDKSAQLDILVELLNRPDVDCVINACDAGREGELIFRLVYEHAHCGKPIKRLWVSSMEDEAVRSGFASLKEGTDFDNLYAAASCRERADWCLGLSATRLFSILYGVTLSVGRVQSPTLAMLVKRETDIDAFVKEPFYMPVIDMRSFAAIGSKHGDRAAADVIAAVCDGKPATILDIERARKTVAPPKLYDLTTLQRDANRLLGYTAQQTLEYVQSLYEKKIASYPRTDARFITADIRDTVLLILGETDFEPDIDRIVGVVSDHHAIIPTWESRNADLTTLPSGEREVFGLIRKRLIAAVSPKHVYESVTVTLDCEGHIFTAKGKAVIEAGWKTQPDEDNESEDAADLPILSKSQTFESVTASIKEGATTPPKHYTEDTLLSAMENAGGADMPEEKVNCHAVAREATLGCAERKGLGTPATRAAIIEKLIKAGFVERQKKNLLPTDKGKRLVAVLPTELTSAKLTAEWEHKLKQIERGELDGDAFMDGIAAFTNAIVLGNAAPKPEFMSLFPESKHQASESLGSCPRCASSVREGAKGFFCDKHSCGFKVWKASKFWTAKKKPLTAAIVSALLKDGCVKLSGLFSEKSGKTYDATVYLDDTGDGFVNFRLEFAKR